jgi:murein DD-endopeptidase MepM/ murein hydrolase activator NlpD
MSWRSGRARYLLAAALVALVISVSLVRGLRSAPEEAATEPPRPVAEAPAPAAAPPRPDDLAAAVRPPTETVLRRRETLDQALRRSRVGRADAVAVLVALRPHLDMRRIQPGERLVLTWGLDDRPSTLTHWRSPLERYEVTRDENRWTARRVQTPVDTRVVLIQGTLEDSLFASVERLGEGPALTAALVTLFEWDFDFAADSLPGDRFRLLVEKRYAEGEFVGYGDVLIAQYRSADRHVLTSVGFPDSQGRVHYYDAHGRSVRKTFLRAPLDFTRITSGFSHARKHPILGGTRPHLAIDYGAPVGTPVRAVADGVVERAGWAGGNGISITLRHVMGYRTMYNHLSKVHVRAGQRVRQRDVIGRVGSTGLSTGPHLDYRVSKNGAFVNPLAERFIPGAPVPRERQQAFRAHLQDLLERLDRSSALPVAGPSS